MSAADSARVSILIPTLNRADFLLRTLRYYAALKFPGKLLVGDSSGPQHTSTVHRFLEGPGAGLDVTYIECPELNDRATVLRLSTLIETPYAALHGDDDVIFPAAAARCAAFLDTHPDYVSAHGRAWLFTVAASGAHGRMALGGDYPLPTTTADSALARLEEHLADYTVTLFTLHRTAAWQAMWRGVDRIADRAFGAEILPCCRSAVLGKSAALDVPYLLRQVHAARYHLPGQAPWRAAPGWQSDFELVCDALAGEVSAVSRGRETPSREDISRLFERTYLNQQAPAETSRDRVMSALARWPRVDDGLRRVRAGLRLARARSGHDLDLRRELDLFVDMTSRRAAA